MKVLLVNGSPHENGCTYTALSEVAKALSQNDIEVEIFHIGVQPVSGCLACKACLETGKCIYPDVVNDFLEISNTADGFVFGTPVHYAYGAGSISSFMDRLFYCNRGRKKKSFYLKPAACVATARRSGATATLDHLTKYFTMSEMPVISSKYWNVIYGSTPEEIINDLEGMQTMRTLGRNMAWFLKCREAGIKAGVPFPVREDDVKSNFSKH